MYIIRETFSAKPGMASKLARLMKDVSRSAGNGDVRVLTDAVGRFNTVVMETEVDDLASFEKRMGEYMQDSRMRDQMKGYTEMYVSGKRQIFKVVD